KEDINLSRFSVSTLVDSILESLEPLATEKGLKLVNTISRELPVLESDSTKCRHILQNVISNALKFTEEGSVKISAKNTTDEIIITIMDTGIGIDPETVPKIFDEFKQADDKMSRKYGGTGLGLAIAKKYVILLGGSIEVHSRPGSGSTFIIALPLVHAGYSETARLDNTEENPVITHTSETD
ncbi:MAG TPA: ATP-binding protein, partial [Bacteroidales bacterium]|nr:ATP-binding protein [Bacteroidales bacterium]